MDSRTCEERTLSKEEWFIVEDVLVRGHLVVTDRKFYMRGYGISEIRSSSCSVRDRQVDVSRTCQERTLVKDEVLMLEMFSSMDTSS